MKLIKVKEKDGERIFTNASIGDKSISGFIKIIMYKNSRIEIEKIIYIKTSNIIEITEE